MPIRWNSILKGSWEITLSQILVRRSLDMGEESVSVSLLSPPLAAPGLVLRGSDLDGEGRRTRMLTPFVCVVCWAGPGINLVQSSLWLTCAMSLAVFDAGKYADGFGNVVEPKICYSDGATRRVLPHLSPFSPIAAPVSTRLCPAA